MDQSLQSKANEIKLANPGRELIHIELDDKANNEKVDVIAALPNKMELTMYIKDSNSDDFSKQQFAMERLVLQCVRLPTAKEMTEILEKRPMYMIKLCAELQRFSGVSVEGEAKKI